LFSRDIRLIIYSIYPVAPPQSIKEESQVTLTGTAILTNTKQYPFNNSAQTVALEASQAHTDYTVFTEVLSSVGGEVGDIIVSGKAVNGFKLAFTGSAAQAEIRYYVISDHK
jgi:hypothetical protein